MTTLSLKIDTYQVVQTLRKKGFTQEQAEGIIEVAREANLDSIVTREYLDMQMDTKLNALEQRLTIRLGGMIMALGAILIVIKYFG